MIYFFHHYELPAILQQIRIQEMLLQNQQAGPGNQSALQDNLNNNTSTATHGSASGPASTAPDQPANNQPQRPTLPSQGMGASTDMETVTSGTASDLDWMAETEAIITEVLSSSAPLQLGGSLLERSVGALEGGAELERETGSQEGSMLGGLHMGGAGIEALGGGNTEDISSSSLVVLEFKTIGTSAPCLSPLLPLVDPQEIVSASINCSSHSSSHTDCKAGLLEQENCT